jgi:hypothetical protein
MSSMGNAAMELTNLEWVKQFLEYLGGERDQPPPGFSVPLSNWLFWGLWWGALSVLIFLFCGQSSKFIYIDF